MTDRIKLGVSACLLGQKVRYDGQHKHDPFLTDTLGPYIDFVPVCPEVECGLPIPREAMRLVGDPDHPRLITRQTCRDLTDKMLSWVDGKLNVLAGEGLCGYIFKSKSPSSGMERVKVYNDKGGIAGHGPGLFAGAFMRRFPLLPVEDEGRLHDPVLRENFIERVFALFRYREQVGPRGGLDALMSYHASHKLLIMAHSETHMRAMGKMLAASRRRDADALRTVYEEQLLAALRCTATVRKHSNVLMHMLGYFKAFLTPEEKREMLDLIDQFRSGLLPLIVPVTMVRHFALKYGVVYLNQSVYLSPHPLELKLRNHA